MKQENEENIKDKSNSPYDYIEKKRTKFLALPLNITLGRKKSISARDF